MEAVRPGSRTSSALLITLLTMGLMTIIVVAFLGTMSSEVTLSRRDYDNQRARAMTTLGMNVAVAQLRNALGVWDNPFVNFTNTTQPTYYWSVSPGMLVRWPYAQAAPPATNYYPLFSVPATNLANSFPVGDGTYAATTNLVNLNAPAADGSYPIAGAAPATTAPNISVYWVNVLQNPNAVAGAANPIVGRYAYWVDDENAKININTADGTLKYTTNSLGAGTPSEVDLRMLAQGGSALSTTVATNIVYLARTTGFNSPREIMRASGTTPDLYTNNAFYLTTFGRSPELNVFGEPKIYFIPASPATNGALTHGVLETNNITEQALTEVYPTPSQLPPMSTLSPDYEAGSYTFQSDINNWRPLVFTCEWPMEANTGNVHGHQGDSESWMMDQISLHLGGMNSVGESIVWPVFPGASGVNFIGKYSLRQLDDISAQITDLGGKTIFPEANSISDISSGAYNLPFTCPSTPTGFLSRETVIGLARSAKISEVFIDLKAFGAFLPSPVTTANPYLPPYINMAVYIETCLPPGYAGVDLFNVNNGLPPCTNYAGLTGFGANAGNYQGALNMLDELSPMNTNPPTTNFTFPVASLMVNSVSKLYPTNGAPIAYSTTTGNVIPANCTTTNFWAGAILRNNQGIDFEGNPSMFLDPDSGQGTGPSGYGLSGRAKVYHSYLTNSIATSFYTKNSHEFSGNGPDPTNICPILLMGPLTSGSATTLGKIPWYAGQYRTVENSFANSTYGMTNVNTATTLTISGGIIAVGHSRSSYQCDPEPTPFDAAVRGYPYLFPTAAAPGIDDINNEPNTNTIWKFTPGNPNQTTQPTAPTETIRDHMVNGAIPVNINIAVPAASASHGAAGNEVFYDASVADLLVNKYPGDWVSNNVPTMGNGSSAPTMSNSPGGYAIYYGSGGANNVSSTYKDPDAYWLPPLDPKIPRSARFPNIGYLNYIRTGIIPDDETVSITGQHGTPFRCLNLNAAGDASQTITPAVAGVASPAGYPDWAMLDLFTVPSTLLPYGGPYGYYSYNTNNGVSTWTPGALMSGNPTNMYYYGTWGGSTPGRINPNGAVVYTTNVTVPTPGISRLVPLEALLTNIVVNQVINSGSGGTPPPQYTNAPSVANSGYSGGATVAAGTVVAAITSYLSTNANGTGSTPAPFREPAEICNLLGGYSAATGNPGVDSSHNNPTRNDLVRQIVGNLTTQSNVYSVWVAGQTITKSKANTGYGIYESGDQITSSVRYHYVVERYLQGGAGGVYGNTQNPLPHFGTAGTGAYPVGALTPALTYTNAVGDVDGIVGTYDDPMDVAYHPPNPRYLYRVIYAEEIRD